MKIFKITNKKLFKSALIFSIFLFYWMMISINVYSQNIDKTEESSTANNSKTEQESKKKNFDWILGVLPNLDGHVDLESGLDYHYLKYYSSGIRVSKNERTMVEEEADYVWTVIIRDQTAALNVIDFHLPVSNSNSFKWQISPGFHGLFIQENKSETFLWFPEIGESYNMRWRKYFLQGQISLNNDFVLSNFLKINISLGGVPYQYQELYGDAYETHSDKTDIEKRNFTFHTKGFAFDGGGSFQFIDLFWGGDIILGGHYSLNKFTEFIGGYTLGGYKRTLYILFFSLELPFVHIKELMPMVTFKYKQYKDESLGSDVGVEKVYEFGITLKNPD